MKNIILLLLFVFPLQGYAMTYHSGDTLYVWNIRGTCLMAGPSATSDTIALLKLGALLKVAGIQQQQFAYAKEVDDSLKLRGFWIKVKTGNQTGYAFDGDCFATNPFPVNGKKGGSKSLLYRILGPKLDYRKMPKKFKIGKDSTEYQVVYKITTYRNGTETESYFDGCDDDDYLFYHLNFAQTYHLMVLTEYFSFNTQWEHAADNNYMGVPRLSYSSTDDYEFGGLSGGANIYIKKNGIEISFSLCD